MRKIDKIVNGLFAKYDIFYDHQNHHQILE